MRTYDTPIRVLLVDDHELVRAGLRTMLGGDPGVDVVGDADTGAAALAQARALMPDLVLLDARLPDMDGDEVCQRLLVERPDLAVVILTTFAEDDLVRRCVRAGARGYLLKDIAHLDLGRNLRAVMRGEAVIDSKVAPAVLAAARLAAQSVLESEHEAPRNGDPREALESIRGLSALGNEQMREAIFALSRADLQDRGLERTLWTVVRDFRERTGLEADLVLVGRERLLPPETAEALLAVVREALVNVEQHARATSVVVTLRRSRGGVTLAVQDDGIGAPALLLRSIGSSFTHFGLRGLQERIRKVGGGFTARNGDDGGLVVRVRVPVSDSPAAGSEAG